MVLDQIANMEIKWTWISNQFNHRHIHHFNYYTTSLSCMEGKWQGLGERMGVSAQQSQLSSAQS